MPAPDFTKKTIDLIAKKAAYICSNPDCRKQTIGPNEDGSKSITIGEAAHICAARIGQSRFDHNMLDKQRAELTNAIWLCRNCHKMIDADEKRFTQDILLIWREQHEKFVASQFGKKTQAIEYDLLEEKLSEFSNYPPKIRRIVIDEVEGWQLSLYVELLRYLNEPVFRRIEDIQSGATIGSFVQLNEDDALPTLSAFFPEMTKTISPFVPLLERLSANITGKTMTENPSEILHNCLLLRDAIERMANLENKIRSVSFPEEFETLHTMLFDLVASQAIKLKQLPEIINHALYKVEIANETGDDKEIIVEHTIVFDIPEKWNRDFNRELGRLQKNIQSDASENVGCATWFWGVMLLLIIAMLF